MMRLQDKYTADKKSSIMTFKKNIITFMLSVLHISVLMTSLLLSLGMVAVSIVILKTGQAIKKSNVFGTTKVTQ